MRPDGPRRSKNKWPPPKSTPISLNDVHMSYGVRARIAVGRKQVQTDMRKMEHVSAQSSHQVGCIRSMPVPNQVVRLARPSHQIGTGSTPFPRQVVRPGPGHRKLQDYGQAELRNPLGENDRRTVGRPGVHAADSRGLRRSYADSRENYFYIVISIIITTITITIIIIIMQDNPLEVRVLRHEAASEFK